MAQHFLLSARARSLSLATVLRMTVEEAERAFIAVRWAATAGKPHLPALRMRDGLRMPPTWPCTAVPLQSVPQGLLYHVGHDLRASQDAAPQLPLGHRDLLQRS